MADAVPTVETDRLDVMELQRRLALVDYDWHRLSLVERIGCFGPHPMRSDRMLRPHHDDDTGLRNRFLDLRVVGVALLDAAAVDPHRHAFLLQCRRKGLHRRCIDAGVAEEYLLHR